MCYWKTKFKIRDLEFPRFLGGPLDGVTDSPFRKVVRKFSTQELLYTEMRHIARVANETWGKKTTEFDQLERPLNFQVAANKVDFIEKACDRILQQGIDCIDLNIGCPARNLISSGSGSALMNDLPRLKKILICFREKIKHIPFTVKMRAGFKVENAIEVAKLVQDCGADAMAIHPRLQSQKFSGTPDYNLAYKVKKSVDIPVLFSGGVTDFTTAKSVYENTGVDGFLIGRGLWAKPWKLKELHENSIGNEYTVDKSLILKCIFDHLDNHLDYYGQNGLVLFRKHLSVYLKGMPFSCDVRKIILLIDSVDKIKSSLMGFLGT